MSYEKVPPESYPPSGYQSHYPPTGYPPAPPHDEVYPPPQPHGQQPYPHPSKEGGYQDYFVQPRSYHPPSPHQFYNHHFPRDHHRDSGGVSPFLRGCLAAICCCCVFEECCCF